MRVVVTGASGFIGGYVCRTLIDAGHQVTAAVRRSGSAPVGTREVIVGDLGPDLDWSAVVEGHDAVVHLAARVHVMNETAVDPVKEFRVANVEGTLRLARQAAGAGVRRFVFVSSIKAIASESGAGPIAFDAPDNRTDPYGSTKREAELALTALSAENVMSLVIIRPVVVYGPGVGGNILRLLKLIVRQAPVPLGRVSNRRSMIWVGNLSALVKASLESPTVPSVPILAADADALSTPQVVRELATGMGIVPRLVPFPIAILKAVAALLGRRDDVERLVGDLEVIRNVNLITGYQEISPARDALRATGRSYRGDLR